MTIDLNDIELCPNRKLGIQAAKKYLESKYPGVPLKLIINYNQLRLIDELFTYDDLINLFWFAIGVLIGVAGTIFLTK